MDKWLPYPSLVFAQGGYEGKTGYITPRPNHEYPIEKDDCGISTNNGVIIINTSHWNTDAGARASLAHEWRHHWQHFNGKLIHNKSGEVYNTLDWANDWENSKS